VKKILFVGQCKQGSNSLHKLITDVQGFEPGKDIRAMVRSYSNPQDYFDNFSKQEIKNAKYLVDKSIINPFKYDYHVGDYKNHKLIYMIRNIYNMLKSQFLIVLAGEESYQYNIPKFKKKWDNKNLTEEMVKEIMDYNKQKYIHYDVISNLPKDVFHKDNTLFCTFEDFIDDTNNQFNRLEEFLDISLNSHEYPRVNSTRFEWYANSTTEYEYNTQQFEKFKDFIYDYCIDKEVWRKLSEITGIDFISKYNIK